MGRNAIFHSLQGTGKKKLERQLESLEEMFPDKFRAVMKFNAPLAHQMMAGGDIIVIPSRFEPCGLVQFQGMKYGTVCILLFSFCALCFVLTKCACPLKENTH